MTGSALDRLRELCIVVADTGDIAQIRRFTPQDATTNPSLLLKALQTPEYAAAIRDTIAEVKKAHPGIDAKDGAQLVADQLAVAIAGEILSIVPGRVSVEVDARLSHDADATVSRVERLLHLMGERGVEKSRVYIKIAATWQGICACERLQKAGVDCNMTLVFSLAQAAACAAAGATLISPFVGRMLDWHKARSGDVYTSETDPGVVSVRAIYKYMKAHGYSTQVMAASFRNTGEILALAGVDKITIAPQLLEELQAMPGEGVERALSPSSTDGAPAQVTLSESSFLEMLAADAAASDLLPAGIAAFVRDTDTLEQLIAQQWA